MIKNKDLESSILRCTCLFYDPRETYIYFLNMYLGKLFDVIMDWFVLLKIGKNGLNLSIVYKHSSRKQ